jgi:hypothetical protein
MKKVKFDKSYRILSGSALCGQQAFAGAGSAAPARIYIHKRDDGYPKLQLDLYFPLPILRALKTLSS